MTSVLASSTATRRVARLAPRVLVLALALGSSACVDPQTLGTLRGVITAPVMLQDAAIQDLAARSAQYAKTWAAALTVLSLFWLHFRLRQGDHDALVSFIIHTTLGYALLVPTLREPLYWPRAAAQVGQDVADLYPVTDWIVYGGATPSRPVLGIGDFARVGWEAVRALRERVSEGGDRREPGVLEAEALSLFLGTPWGALLVTLATVGSYLSALALQVIQATLLTILAVLFPVMAPLVLTPWTRGLFWGYLRWVMAVILWGAMFRIIDAVMLAVQLRTLTEPITAALRGDAATLAQVLPNFLAAGVVVNLAFFGLQFAAPGLAFGIVHGTAQRSIR